MIKCKVFCLQVITLFGIIHAAPQNLQKSTISAASPETQLVTVDSQLAASGFSDAVQAGSKYFQYAHQPLKDHYEAGHKRGNEHHFIERHEKAQPHEGEFKTKVRWGDKHGGYGEHYWDYNHAGHGRDDDNGEETQQVEERVPYQTASRQRRLALNKDVEFVDESSRGRILSDPSIRHGGNYRQLPESGRSA